MKKTRHAVLQKSGPVVHYQNATWVFFLGRFEIQFPRPTSLTRPSPVARPTSPAAAGSLTEPASARSSSQPTRGFIIIEPPDLETCNCRLLFQAADQHVRVRRTNLCPVDLRFVFITIHYHSQPEHRQQNLWKRKTTSIRLCALRNVSQITTSKLWQTE